MIHVPNEKTKNGDIQLSKCNIPIECAIPWQSRRELGIDQAIPFLLHLSGNCRPLGLFVFQLLSRHIPSTVPATWSPPHHFQRDDAARPSCLLLVRHSSSSSHSHRFQLRVDSFALEQRETFPLNLNSQTDAPFACLLISKPFSSVG